MTATVEAAVLESAQRAGWTITGGDDRPSHVPFRRRGLPAGEPGCFWTKTLPAY